MSTGGEGIIFKFFYDFIWIPALVFLGKIFWDVKTTSSNTKRLEKLERDYELLHISAITEDKVRSLLKDEIGEIKSDLKTVVETVTQLRIDTAGKNAARRFINDNSGSE